VKDVDGRSTAVRQASPRRGMDPPCPTASALSMPQSIKAANIVQRKYRSDLNAPRLMLNTAPAGAQCAFTTWFIAFELLPLKFTSPLKRAVTEFVPTTKKLVLTDAHGVDPGLDMASVVAPPAGA